MLITQLLNGLFLKMQVESVSDGPEGSSRKLNEKMKEVSGPPKSGELLSSAQSKFLPKEANMGGRYAALFREAFFRLGHFMNAG